MAGKLTARGVESLAKRKGRFLDGDGLFLRVLDPGKRVYWVYRFRLNGLDRETRRQLPRHVAGRGAHQAH